VAEQAGPCGFSGPGGGQVQGDASGRGRHRGWDGDRTAATLTGGDLAKATTATIRRKLTLVACGRQLRSAVA
jgi:hypothetical protein